MERAEHKNEINLTHGKILNKLLRLAVPIIVTNVLLLLFNAVDIIILGIFVSDDAVAAVGANSSLINLFVNLFIGFSVGSNIVLSKCVGENDLEKAHRVVGVSVIISVSCGILITIVGILSARQCLIWMNCDASLLDDACLYIRIFFLGMPVILLYNFCSALLRAVGDTFRPMIFLIIAGIINVGLNIFFVLVLHKTVDGVAIATVISQAIACLLSVVVIIKNKGFCALKAKYLKLFKKEFCEILTVGIPAGIQSCLFAISNILIQSSVNSIGKLATAGNAVASQFDSLVYAITNSMAVASMSFVGQNYGAKEFDRIKKGLHYAILLQFIFSFVSGWIVVLCSGPLASIISKDPDVIHYAQVRIFFLCALYFLCGFMDTYSYALKALGKPMSSMVISLVGVCVFRIIWLKTIFKFFPYYWIIFLSYSVSWVLTLAITMPIVYRSIKNKAKELKNENI